MLKDHKFLAATILTILSTAPLHAAYLQASTFVNITSDTAANAKNIAFDEARRQIISDILRQYSIADQLLPVIKDSKSDELTNLITSSTIDGEQLSDTTYSANITMTINPDAAHIKEHKTKKHC